VKLRNDPQKDISTRAVQNSFCNDLTFAGQEIKYYLSLIAAQALVYKFGPQNTEALKKAYAVMTRTKGELELGEL
jgi:hypothetical protein